MSGRLRAYDGALNGVDVVHGLIVKSGSSERFNKNSATPKANLSSGSEVLPHRSVLEIVLERATDVIGRREEAMRWLGTPVRALNYATPVSLLADDAGVDQVLAVLANLEHGVL